MASRAHTRVLTAALIVAAAQAAWSAGCRSDPSDEIKAEWTLDPSPPVAGASVVARVTLTDSGQKPVLGAKLRLEGQMSHPGMTPVLSDLIERGGGTYEARLRLTMAGDWVLVVSGELRDGTRLTKQLDLPGIRQPTG